MAVVWSPQLSAADDRFRRTAAELAAQHFGPAAAAIDHDQRYPWEHVERLVDSGLTGMFVPPIYGGQGASLVATCAAIEEVAGACASTAAIMATHVLGGLPVLIAGSEPQKQLCLRALTRDGQATSFALTEPEAGSDARAITATAEPVDGGYRLRGEKWFVGNGGASRFYIVFAQMASHATRRIGAFLLDRERDEITIDHYEDKMGIRGTLTSNLRVDAIVGDDAVLGDPQGGLRLALQTLDVGRITVAAQAIGVGLAALTVAVERATTRAAFGAAIIDHQGIGFRLADVATEMSAARMLLYDAAATYDRGDDVTARGAMAKLYGTEAAHRAVDAAVQVFGGYGYCKPSPVERFYRDQRVTELYEGTSEIQRLVLARLLKQEAAAP